MSERETTAKLPAALDTLTVVSASEFFEKGPNAPPYARECLITYIDLVTNYQRVVFPRPSGNLLAPDPRDALLLKRGIGEGWLEQWPGEPASDIDMTKKQLDKEYRDFAETLKDRETRGSIDQWSALAFQRDEIANYDCNDGARNFWELHEKRFKNLGGTTRLRWDTLRQLFELFARTYQYDRILDGRALYVPHPFRRRACASAIRELATDAHPRRRWSWGRYFVWLTEHQGWPYSQVATHITMVREETLKRRATWDDLWDPNRPIVEHDARAEALTRIAERLELPQVLRDDTKRLMTKVVGGAVLIDIPTSFLGLPPLAPIVTGVLITGVIVLNKVAASGVRRLPFTRGLMEWPGLFPDAAAQT